MRISRETRISDEAGFGLIEVVISAFILVTVTFGTLVLIDHSEQSQARNRSRSAAAAIAERNQEVLRALNAKRLANSTSGGTFSAYSPAPHDETISGVTFHVTQRAEFIREDTQAAPTCENADGKASYMQFTTTVTPSQAHLTSPVTLVSYYTPQAGSIGKHLGALIVRAWDRTGAAGVQNVPIKLTGPQSAAQSTNSLGCALFENLDVGTAANKTYTVTWGSAALGFVDMNGVRAPTMTTTLNEGNIQRVEKRYDRAGSLDVSTTLTNTGVTGATAPIKSYGYTVLNGTNNVTRTFPATRPTTALTTPVDADDLFPFTDGYQFYNGTCGANDPTKYSLAASTLASLGAGSTNVPVSAKEPVQRFLYQKNGAAQVSKPFHVAATQRTSITVGSTTYTCVADRFEYTGVTSSTGTLGVPLPFGDYTVCVDDAAGGNNNTKVTLASAVQVRALNPTQQTLNITSGTKGAAC